MISFPFGTKTRNPDFFEISCEKCGWCEMLELSPCEVDVIPAPGEMKEDGPEIVTALPKRCPICGSRVNRRRIPVVVKN